MTPIATPTVNRVAVARVASATLAQAAAILPLVLVAAFAGVLRDDLGFDAAALGLLSGIYFTVAALFAPVSGRLVERFGPTVGLRVGVAIAAATLVGSGTATRWASLVPFVALSGLSMAVAQPASDLWLSRHLGNRRLGLAFAVKQAVAGPGAGLVAGSAAALLIRVGWRWVFLGCGLTMLLALLPLRRAPLEHAVARDSSHGDVSLGPLLILTSAGALASLSQSGFLAFAVSSGISAGLSASRAGLAFAVASGSAIAARLILGAAADRWSGALLRTVAAVIAVSSMGFGLLAVGGTVPTILGTVIAGATSWGWHGLFFLVVARCNASAPGRASGIVASGLLAGSAVGPVVFGSLVRDGFASAWGFAGISALLAAGAMLVGRRSVRRDLAERGDPLVAPRVPTRG